MAARSRNADAKVNTMADRNHARARCKGKAATPEVAGSCACWARMR